MSISKALRVSFAPYPTGSIPNFISRVRTSNLMHPISFDNHAVQSSSKDSPVRRLHDATAKVIIEHPKRGNYTPKGHASAVIVSTDGLVVTVEHIQEEDNGVKPSKFFVKPPGLSMKRAKILAIDPSQDIAILKIPELPEDPYRFSPLSFIPPKKGDLVVTSGYRHIGEKTWLALGEILAAPFKPSYNMLTKGRKKYSRQAKALIKQRLKDFFRDLVMNFRGQIVATNPTSFGGSGSQLCNLNGEVTGILRGLANKKLVYVLDTTLSDIQTELDSFSEIFMLQPKTLSLTMLSGFEPIQTVIKMLEKLNVNPAKISEGEPSKIK